MGFAKHNNRGIIHLYRWTAENTRVADTRLEIDAHENGVNDLALTNLDGALVVVSGGGDCKVKVWSATLGQLMFCFTGTVQHEAPGSLRSLSVGDITAASIHVCPDVLQAMKVLCSQCALTSRATYLSFFLLGEMVASRPGYMTAK